MKIGGETPLKLAGAGLFLVASLILVLYMYFGRGEDTSAAAAAANQKNGGSAAPRVARGGVRNRAQAAPPDLGLDPTLRLAMLAAAEDAKYSGSGRNIFQDRAEEPPKMEHGGVLAKNPLPGPQPDQAPVIAPPPPIPLKFYGFASRTGEAKRIFLSQGEDIYIAREGEIVARRYRVVKINNNNVEIEDMQFNNRQSIPLTAQVPG
jgi:hypothetical protein